MIGALSLTGYWFGADELFGIAHFTAIALQTSTMIAVLAVGTMAAIPEHGLVAAIARKDEGGTLLRRLIVPVVLYPWCWVGFESWAKTPAGTIWPLARRWAR